MSRSVFSAPRAALRFRRAVLLAGGCLLAAGPAWATRELMPREQYAALIARGEFDAGRESFRNDTGRLREELHKAETAKGITGLGQRANLLNDLTLMLQSWADGEAMALYQKNAPSSGPALRILTDELLPAAIDVTKTRAAYVEEANRLEAGLDPATRQSSGWVLDAVRWPEEAKTRLPLSLARLAKVAGSLPDVQRVFGAFRGKIGTFASAAEYFAAPEDYSRSLELTPSTRAPRVMARAAPEMASDDEAGIRTLLTRFYRALVKHDARSVDACLASTSSQRAHIKRRMRGRGIVNVGEIGRLSLERRPDGSVAVTADDIPITAREGGGEVVRRGAQHLVVVREGGEWKILEVGR